MPIITPSMVLNEAFMPKYSAAAAGGPDIQMGENTYYGFGRSHMFNSAVGSVADGYRVTLGSAGGALYLKNSGGTYTALNATDLIQFRGGASGIYINGVKASAATSSDGQIYWSGPGLGTDLAIMNIQAIGKDDAFNTTFDSSRPIAEGGTGTDAYSATLALTVDILVVNGQPTLTVTGLNPTFTEGAGAAQGAAVAAFSSATIGVLEGAQKVIGLTFVVSGTTLNANDLITFDGTQISLSGNSAGTTATNMMSYSVTITGGNLATVALTSVGGVTGAAVQTLINAIAYQNAVVEDPVAANRTFAISQIKDDGGVLVGGDDTNDLSGLTSVVTIQNVNDAPVITVPGAQLLGGATLTFDTAGTNTITLSDVDTSPAASITVVVSTGGEGTLEVDPDGAATANGGMAVVSGTSTITLVGTLADINSSLDGLIYTTPGMFDGSATVTVDATDSDGTTLAIQKSVIVGVTPAVTSVDFTNGSFKAGADLTFTAVFSAAVDVTGFPTIAIDVGGNARTATYVSGTGTTSLVFKYTVQAGETDADGVTVPAGSISLAGGTINRATTLTPAVLTLNGIDASTGVIVDTTQPTVSITLSDSALKIGDTSLVTITFNEAVTGFDNSDLGTIEAGSLSTVTTSDNITWTAILTPTTTLEDATNVITLTSAGVTDIAGNTVTGANTSANYAVDTLRPTATITVSNTALNSVATSLVTIAFSEAVVGFTNVDLTIENGTLSTVTTSDGGVTWTATLTPQALVTDATNVITLDNTGVADQAGNAGDGSTTSNNYAVSTNTPSATITLSDSSLIFAETSLVTITFNEVVTGFDNTDLGLIPAGALSAVTSGDGITWTATLTPATPLTDLTNVITLDNTLVNSVGTGNAGVGTSTSANYVVDTVPPTVTITLSDSSLIIGETSLVTITFSEAVTGFDNTDLGTIAAGSLSTVSTADGGITWTATLTPTTPLEDATNVITLDSAGVQDLRGNTVTGSNTSANYAVDTVRPAAVSITVTDTSLIGGETSLVTIVFSEAVTAFSNADLIIDNGMLSTVTTSDNITWTATLTPNASVQDPSNAISVDNSTLTDLAGNAGLASLNSNNYAIDNLGPTVVSVTVTDTLLTIGETSLVTIVFSEAVTGFTNSDFSGGGMSFADDVVVSGLASLDGITWTATLTPNAAVPYNGPGYDLLSVDATDVSDLAGNVGTGFGDSNAYDVDTTRPTVVSIGLSDSTLTTGETTEVTIIFSEAVTSFSNADLTVDAGSGALSAVTTSDNITWTATLTPTALTTDLTNVITLNNATVTDLQGNAGTGTTDSLNYIVSTAGPSATITLADSTLIVGETSLVTITFSEAVTDFDNTDLTVDAGSGALSAVTTSDNITWTATLTPAVTTTDLTNVITLDQTDVQSVSTLNFGVGTSSSANYVVDTVAPTVTITVADTTLIVGETSLVTITFSEAVTGFDNADLGTIEAGSLSTVSTGDGGVTWTATLTPTTPLTDLTNVVTLDSAGVQDLRGNTVTGSNTSANYVVDTVAPTVSITLADSSLIGGETSLVTITFSEAITNFDNSDLTIESGTLDTVTTSDNITWTATFTPAAATEDATNVITLTSAGVQDLRGNNVTGSNASANYAVDTVAPTVVSVTVADTLLIIGETSLVTIVFSEAVTGFTDSDFSGGGMSFADDVVVSGLASLDGITWTATLTPDAGVDYMGPAFDLLEVNATDVSDLAGNLGTGFGDSNSYDVDTTRPTVVSIGLSDSALQIGDTSELTIIFTEAVTGFTNADLGTIEAGSLSTVTTSDGGVTWTATLTPTTPLEDATNVITLTNSGISDLQGNAGTGTNTTANYEVDTIAPAPLFNLSSYNPTTNTLVLYGQNIDTIAAISASVLPELDLTKIVWDINNDGITTPDFSFGGNVLSAVVTDANTLTIVLTGVGATMLEALMGYGTSGGADLLTIADGFTSDTVGNLDVTSGDTTPLNILGRFNDGSATDAGQFSFNYATDTDVVDVYVGEDVRAVSTPATAGSVDFAGTEVIVLSGTSAAEVVVAPAANTTLTVGATAVTLVGFDASGALNSLNNTRVLFSDGSQLLTNTTLTSVKLSASVTGTTNDQLIAGGLGDTLQAFAGDDLLIGGAGSDSLYGGIGADTLWGKSGNDYLVGGNGADKFQYTRLATADDGHDIIAGFKGGVGGDQLHFTDITTAAAQMISFTQVGSEVLLFNGSESIRITGITGTFSTANLLGNT